MTHDEAIAYIQAHKDGKTVEALDCGRYYSVGNLTRLLHAIANGRTLRIKPEPITVRGWVNVYADGNYSSYRTKEEADRYAADDRIACIRIEREVEEGEGL